MFVLPYVDVVLMTHVLAGHLNKTSTSVDFKALLKIIPEVCDSFGGDMIESSRPAFPSPSWNMFNITSRHTFLLEGQRGRALIH